MSALTQNPAVWRCRVAGGANNGAGYDGTTYAGGVDYTDQDAAQTSGILGTSSASTTFTDATASFPSNCVGNAILLSSGTGATVGYYFITAYVSATQVTLDRVSGTYSTGVWAMGGAMEITRFKTIIDSSTVAGLKVIPGNTVYVRGAGTTIPSANDYVTTGYITVVSGDITNGRVKVIGYNGRPRIQGNGLLFYSMSYDNIENMYITTNGASNGTIGMFSAGGDVIIKDCIINTNNQAGLKAINGGSVINCEVWSGTTTPTASAGSDGITVTNYNPLIIGCYVHHMGGIGITMPNIAMGTITNNIIYANKGDGINMSVGTSPSYTYSISNNTIDGNGGHGIILSVSSAINDFHIYNNIISNHTTAAKFAISVAGTLATNNRMKQFIDYNNLFNNTGTYSGISAGTHDTTLDPQYTSVGTDFSVGTNMKAIGFPSVLPPV